MDSFSTSSFYFFIIVGVIISGDGEWWMYSSVGFSAIIAINLIYS